MMSGQSVRAESFKQKHLLLCAGNIPVPVWLTTVTMETLVQLSLVDQKMTHSVLVGDSYREFIQFVSGSGHDLRVLVSLY